MPSKRGTEQAILWLKNVAADRNSLDGINAELCLNVIKDLQNQNRKKGALIHRLKVSTNDQMLDKESENA